MLKWTIFFRELNGKTKLPVLRSVDGCYYLGGKHVDYLLFYTEAEAEKIASRVRKDKFFASGFVYVRKFKIIVH